MDNSKPHTRKKYFFFDIDGTLTDRYTRKIVPSALKAVEKLQEAGHFVSLCTGRAMYKADLFRTEHGFANMVCNGGMGIVFENEVKENAPLDYDKAKAVYDQALELGYGVLCTINDTQEVYARDFTFYDQVGPRKEPTTYIIDENFDPEDKHIIFKLYVSIPEAEEEKLTAAKELGSLRFVPEYLMFQHDEKKQGILNMLEYAGGRPEDVVVFGDDYNDLDMFDPAFTRVAMGNACQELKDQADFVAEENVKDGIWKICVEKGWIPSELADDENL